MLKSLERLRAESSRRDTEFRESADGVMSAYILSLLLPRPSLQSCVILRSHRRGLTCTGGT